MAWFKVDDTLWSHPKFATLTDAAQALWLRAGSYSAEKLTDGVVAEQIIVGLLRGKKRTVDELVGAGLWRRTPDGVEFHDWLEYQPSAESVKRSREQARERMANVRANKRRSSHNPDPDPVPKTKTDDGDTHKPGTKVDARDDDPVLEGFQALGFTSPAARGRVLTAVRGALPFGVVSDAEVVDVARVLLSGSTTHVRYPVSYVERACETPADVVRVWESLPKVVA